MNRSNRVGIGPAVPRQTPSRGPMAHAPNPTAVILEIRVRQSLSFHLPILPMSGAAARFPGANQY